MPRLPSTQSLRAVEAFARHGTVWQAAEELNLTRSAVSHQLRLLERELGFALLNRVGTRVELTPRGRAYAEDVRKALGAIADSAVRHAGDQLSGSITISSTPGFASSWLCTNIGDFLASYPELDLQIVTPRRLDDTATPDVDVFITFGYEGQAGMEVELLKEVEFTPICTPAYLYRHGGLGTARKFREAKLLHIFDHSDWETWFRGMGYPEHEARRGITFQDMNLVFATTLASQGIAMGDLFVWRDALESGQLARPFDFTVASDKAYYLATPTAKLSHPAVAAFHDWLKRALHRTPAA